MLIVDFPNQKNYRKTTKFDEFAHYGYGFYGYKGISIVEVATDCISVGDIIKSMNLFKFINNYL